MQITRKRFQISPNKKYSCLGNLNKAVLVRIRYFIEKIRYSVKFKIENHGVEKLLMRYGHFPEKTKLG